jgi:hypothetical protein
MSTPLQLALPAAPALRHDLSPAALPARAPVVRTLDFAAMTEADATRLQGRRVRVVVELVPDTDAAEGGWTVYEAVSRRADDMRTVWADGELEAEGVQLVEGTLQVIHHGAWGGFERFTEYRLRDARTVRP